MNIPSWLRSGVDSHPKLHKDTMLWITQGVYFGYPENEIINFYERCSKRIFAPGNTPFDGTGYICSDPIEDTEGHLLELNLRRYCPLPFPEHFSPEQHFEHLEKVFDSSKEFRETVSLILDKLGAKCT